ncbi:MAG: hypothetical protein GC149_13495 [Gammaproteobacteria bacterium]|nr:hypothetical protein [Gammaproteobacteria bacterium]
MHWLTSVGGVVAVPTTLLKDTITVSADGTLKENSSSAMSGFSIIKADSIQAALSIEQACPFLEIGGPLEVSELIEMPVQQRQKGSVTILNYFLLSPTPSRLPAISILFRD